MAIKLSGVYCRWSAR